MFINIEVGMREGTYQLVAIYPVSQRIQFPSVGFAEIPNAQDHLCQTFRHDRSFAFMNDTLVEFMYSANMIVVCVSGYRCYVLVENVFRSRPQAYDSKPCINEHISVAAFHMPNIASNEGIDIGFPQ